MRRKLKSLWGRVGKSFDKAGEFLDRITAAAQYLFWGGLLNILAFIRLLESFGNPDANKDGLVTISDFGIHAKETFFATGDKVTLFVADTSFGQFFEMNTTTPALALSFVVSFILWFILYFGLQILIIGEEK